MGAGRGVRCIIDLSFTGGGSLPPPADPRRVGDGNSPLRGAGGGVGDPNSPWGGVGSTDRTTPRTYGLDLQRAIAAYCTPGAGKKRSPVRSGFPPPARAPMQRATVPRRGRRT